MAEVCKEWIAFRYSCIDRLILNAYIPRMQTPAAMAVFLREVCGKPILSGWVFKDLTERFVDRINQFAAASQVDILQVKGKTRPGELGQKHLEAARRAGRTGLIVILKHQEQARVFASEHRGGRDTNFWVKQDFRVVNHYYFYFRDPEYGSGFVRICSYPPFSARIWVNAHGYIKRQLEAQNISFRADQNCFLETDDPKALQQAADRFNRELVEKIARKWLRWLPDPLTPEQRNAGYHTELSVYQAEFCHNLVFKSGHKLNPMYDQLLRDQLHMGQADMVQVVFDRRIRRNTPTDFFTRIVRHDSMACIKIPYKSSWMKQYNKSGRVLRTEMVVGNPNDFGVKKRLVHLDYLQTVASHAIKRFSKAQAAAMSAALDRSTFEQLITPSTHRGKRAAALRIGAPGEMRVLEAVGCAGLIFRAFSNADLRDVMIRRLGTEPAEVSAGQVGYRLRKLRGKGLVRKVPHHNRYTLTDKGYRIVIFLLKIHSRVLGPPLDTLASPARDLLHQSKHPIDKALARLNDNFDTLMDLSGIQVAA